MQGDQAEGEDEDDGLGDVVCMECGRNNDDEHLVLCDGKPTDHVVLPNLLTAVQHCHSWHVRRTLHACIGDCALCGPRGYTVSGHLRVQHYFHVQLGHVCQLVGLRQNAQVRILTALDCYSSSWPNQGKQLSSTAAERCQ